MKVTSLHCREIFGDHGGSESGPSVEKRRSPRRSGLAVREASKLAYERSTYRRRVVYSAITEILRALGPLTDDEIYGVYLSEGYPPTSRQNLRTARCEMKDAGKAVFAGQVGLSDLGNTSRLWMVVNPNPSLEMNEENRNV